MRLSGQSTIHSTTNTYNCPTSGKTISLLVGRDNICYYTQKLYIFGGGDPRYNRFMYQHFGSCKLLWRVFEQ